MISFEHVSYSYPADETRNRQEQPVLEDLSLSIEEGELVLVVGPSGAGKSTFLRCLNGLVPHFYGGKLQGRIRVADRDPVALTPQGMSQVVGMVFQDPETQFITDRVEDELAFGLENQALPRALMRKRVEEVLDLLTIAHLRDRYLSTLSGGEKQRVAIAAVLAMHPDVLVLDEPTSQLDPQSAEEVVVAIRRLNEDLGLTVLVAEHRLERVVQFVDRVLYLPGASHKPMLDVPRAVMERIPLTPPLVTIGKVQGWHPLPLTVKQARKFVSGQERQLTGSVAAELATMSRSEHQPPREPTSVPLISVQDVSYAYGSQLAALRDVNLALRAGEVVALMGRNGSGKSTLLRLMVGLLKPDRGTITIQVTLGPGPNGGFQRQVNRLDTRRVSVQEIARVVGYVPQNPSALLFKDTLLEELAFTRQGHQLPVDPAADRRLLARLDLSAVAYRYPRDLSTGQRQRAALAAILAADPQVLLLDEPTRGLDYEHKESLTRILLELRARGRSVLVATHDVELAARCADRVVLMGSGEVILDGPTRDVMTGSLVFASQINKLYRNPRYLVVEDVPVMDPEGTRSPAV